MTADGDGDILISLERAGEMLGGISKKSIYRRIAEGVLPPPVKEGKFSRLFLSDITRVLDQMKQQRDRKNGVRNSRQETQGR
jgi:predicted DNA-binding transcriptional regulator AlpA